MRQKHGNPLPGGLSYRPPRVAAQSGSSEKFLFVITAAGGASIVDSFLPVTTSECAAAGGDPNSVLCYPDSTVQSIPGTNIRAVTDLPISSFFGDVYGYSLPQFVGDHKNDLLILAHECTSVNHVVAQERSINGNGINSGRTLMEAFSQAYGSELAIPNCNMSTGGYLRYGTDASLDPRFRAEIISDPYLFAPSTHGSRGIANAPSSEQLARARGVRSNTIIRFACTRI